MMQSGDSRGPEGGGTRRARVLDTSVILSGKRPPMEGPTYAPDAVVAELSPGGRDRRALDYLLEAGLRVLSPSAGARGRVEAAARRTGDLPRLSDADRDVVALALDLDGEVVTDDYSVQNVAAEMGVPFATVSQRGITEVYQWAHRCVGCRRVFEEPVEECDVCGSAVRTVRAGRRSMDRGGRGS